MKLSTTKNLSQISIIAGAMLSFACPAVSAARQDARCIPLPENSFFSELMGINFSTEQAVAYDILEGRVSEMAAKRFKDVLTKELADAPPNIEMKPGASDRVAEEILAAQDEMIRKELTPDAQIRELTTRYGAHAEFKRPRGVAFTEEQLRRREQFRRETEKLMRELLNPGQRIIYDANLERRAEIEACEKDNKDVFPTV